VSGPPTTGTGPSDADAGTITVRGGVPLTGTLEVPGDKSISHRALLLAALGEGTSTIAGLSPGDDVVRTRMAVEALGAGVEDHGPTVVVHGGRSRLQAPAHDLDLGNSGTGMRLLAGIAATLAGTTTLTGDDSLRGRPMDRVADPLTRMGARVTGRGEQVLPPVAVTGGPLQGITYTPPVASAQVKSAILLAGLAADGETVVAEPVATRAYTEEMLAAAGAAVSIESVGVGRVIRIGRSSLSCGAYTVPGDPSQAAFWLLGSVIIPGSLVTVVGLDLSIERLGFVGVLRRMGATIEVEESGNGTGSLTAYYALLHGTTVEAAEIPSLDEVPILAVAAAAAVGTTRFCDVGELRVKESDRLAGTAELVGAFGGEARVEGDDLVVEGAGGPLRPGRVDARGDHRVAMAAAVAAAACPAVGDLTTIAGWESVGTSYPGFSDDLSTLRTSSAGA
jgi:3-phosphoshikimate 1-carboxyvinyltransferase